MMPGNNFIDLCPAALMLAVQNHLNKHTINCDVRVTDVRVTDAGYYRFSITTNPKPEKEPKT